MGVIMPVLYLFLGIVCYHTSVGFPVVYLTFKAMRRPRLVNKQLEVCAFLLHINVYFIQGKIRKAVRAEKKHKKL